MQVPHKWVIAFTVMFGTFMSVMDVSVVNVSLPHMMGAFGADISAITWVATSYAIAQIIMATMAGWWARLIGRKRLYIFSLIVFTIGSILAGTAQNFTQMIVYRAIQGLGGGCLIPLSQAILRETFPIEEQGTAMGIFGMGVVLAPAIGPILGGWLNDNYGWPWIFYVNVPISIPALLSAMAFVHDPPYLRRGVAKIDWVGIALLAVGLTAIQVVLERGQQYGWFSSDFIIGGFVVSGVSLVALVIWELQTPDAIVDIRLLRNIPLSAGSAMGFVYGIGLLGTTFILPQFTQQLLGYSAFQAGMILLPRAATIFILMPIAGILTRKFDARVLVLCGLGFMYWSYYDLSQLSLDAGMWTMMPALLLMGAAMPFVFVTMSAVTLNSVAREDVTHATSLYTLTRTVGGNVGYAMVATFVANGTQLHRSTLVAHINPFDPAYLAFHAQSAAGLLQRGLDPVAADQAATAIANGLVNRQATMLAFNGTFWWMGLFFLMVIPLVFLLPSRPGGNSFGQNND
jgi:DHA2 family multidrug resistance protein